MILCHVAIAIIFNIDACNGSMQQPTTMVIAFSLIGHYYTFACLKYIKSENNKRSISNLI